MIYEFVFWWFYVYFCSVSYLATCEIRNFSWFVLWKIEDCCLIITYKFKHVPWQLKIVQGSQRVMETWECNASVPLQHVSVMNRVRSATQILGSVTALQRASRVTIVNAVTPTTTTMVTQQIRAHVSVSMTVCFCGVRFCKLYLPWILLKSVWRLQKCV
jgi:hypothetical protein